MRTQREARKYKIEGYLKAVSISQVKKLHHVSCEEILESK